MQTPKQQIEAIRHKLTSETGAYCFEHPEESFASIADKFSMSESWVSSAARAVGLGPRRRGRKPKRKAGD